MKRILIAALLLAAGAASAQTVTVRAVRFGGPTPFTGVISFQPTLANGTPASTQMGGSGQTTITPLTAYVTNGAFSLVIPATDLANPRNICYKVTALLKGANVLGPGYSCVQTHAAAAGAGDWCQAGICNFDAYIPNLTAQPMAYYAGSLTQTLLKDAAAIELNMTGKQAAIYALPLDASLAFRTLNAVGLSVQAQFTLIISPDPTAQTPLGLGFGSGCQWRADPASGLDSLSNGVVFPPASSAQVILSVSYDGVYCNVTEVL